MFMVWQIISLIKLNTLSHVVADLPLSNKNKKYKLVKGRICYCVNFMRKLVTRNIIIRTCALSSHLQQHHPVKETYYYFYSTLCSTSSIPQCLSHKVITCTNAG